MTAGLAIGSTDPYVLARASATSDSERTALRMTRTAFMGLLLRIGDDLEMNDRMDDRIVMRSSGNVDWNC